MRRTEFIKLMTISALSGCVTDDAEKYKKAVRLEMLQSKQSLAIRFKLLRSAGFAGLELNSSSYSLADIKRACRQSSLKVVSVENTDNWSQPLNHPDIRVRELAVEAVEKAVYEAVSLGAEFVNVIPGVGIKGETKEDGFKRAGEALSGIKPLLSSTGIKLMLQNVKSGFIESAADMARLLKDFDHPQAGICLDLLNLSEGSLSDWRRLLKEQFFAVHTKAFSQNNPIVCPWHILDGYGGDINWMKASVTCSRLRK